VSDVPESVMKSVCEKDAFIIGPAQKRKKTDDLGLIFQETM
jgi:hypothetical protein